MAKIKNPLQSLAASGSIKGGITFRQTSRGSVVTATPKPYQQTSPAQLTNQQRMRDARTTFMALSSTDAADWQLLANKYRRSSWVCFFAEYQYQNIETPNAPLIPEPYL